MTQLRERLGPTSGPPVSLPPRVKQAPITDAGALHPRAAGSRLKQRIGEVELDDLTAASDLLDDLENQGFCALELVVLGERHFVVRWCSTDG